jgi:hypothetical protein
LLSELTFEEIIAAQFSSYTNITRIYKILEKIKQTTITMATPIQQNLVDSNKKYADSFTKGHLALPPAKKYAVRTFPLPPLLQAPS